MPGLGTWGMVKDSRRRADEIAALRLGLDPGMTLIATAEIYADGAAEELVAEAIAGRRNEIFLVSRGLPTNAKSAVRRLNSVKGQKGDAHGQSQAHTQAHRGRQPIVGRSCHSHP